MPRGKKAIWLAVALALILSLVGWGVAARPASAVVTPLTITTTSLPDGGVGAPYSQTLHASGGTGSYTWARITGLLPAGLSLNAATGVISGTPTTAATFSFVLQVKDGVSSVTKGLSIKIYPRLSTLTINTTTLPAGDVGTAYSQPLSASGGSPPYTWSITVPSLPAGLSLNSATGVIHCASRSGR
jgi:large repetitive protein